jgi:hypothetical protein
MLTAVEFGSIIAVGCKSLMLLGVIFGWLFLHWQNSKTRILPVMALFLIPTLFGSLLHYLHLYEPFGDYLCLAIASPVLWFFFSLIMKFSEHVTFGHAQLVVLSSAAFALAAYMYSSVHNLGLAFAILGLILLGIVVTMTLLSYYKYTLLGVGAYITVLAFGASMIFLLFYGPAIYDNISENTYVFSYEVIQVVAFAVLLFIGWFGYVPASLVKQDGQLKLCGEADWLDNIGYVLATDKVAKVLLKPTVSG